MAETTAHTEVPSDAGHGGAFPPFQTETFASQLLWLALTFGALYLLMSKVALPRIGAILEDRRDRIADDLAEAQRLREGSEQAMAAYEKALADARAKAQAIAAETHEQLMSEAESGRKSLEADLNRKLADAEAKIAATKSAAMSNVAGIAGEATAAIVQRLIGQAPDRATVDRAVADALKR
jgi:F-type H+-transporting ATPase subunit b